eukprot:9670-Rhodomonas_salina.1
MVGMPIVAMASVPTAFQSGFAPPTRLLAAQGLGQRPSLRSRIVPREKSLICHCMRTFHAWAGKQGSIRREQRPSTH